MTVFNPPLEVYSPDDFIGVLDAMDAGYVTPEDRTEIEAEIARRRAQTLHALRGVHGTDHEPE